MPATNSWPIARMCALLALTAATAWREWGATNSGRGITKHENTDALHVAARHRTIARRCIRVRAGPCVRARPTEDAVQHRRFRSPPLARGKLGGNCQRRATDLRAISHLERFDDRRHVLSRLRVHATRGERARRPRPP